MNDTNGKRKAIGRAVLPLLLSLALVITVSGCGLFRQQGSEDTEGAESGPPGPPAAASPGEPAAGVVAVTTTQARLGSISQTLEIGGEVVAEYQVNAFADIAGKVTEVLVEVGDTVAKGQLIAKVDPSKPGQQYAESPVAAPISGTVTSVAVLVGDTSSTTAPIATIGRLNALEIEALVPERFISKVRVGTEAVFSFAAWPGQEFSGRIVKLSPVVDSTSRTMKATLALDRADSRVKAGMYATVGLITDKREGVVIIPAGCVVSRNGKDSRQVVFVVEENRAVQRQVSTGLSSQGMVEITGGIAAGEEVVRSGQSLLSEGVEVRIISSEQQGGGV
jgi:membrane fusion protein (multidrug efflux system)